jgi:hypothetical protein
MRLLLPLFWWLHISAVLSCACEEPRRVRLICLHWLLLLRAVRICVLQVNCESAAPWDAACLGSYTQSCVRVCTC